MRWKCWNEKDIVKHNQYVENMSNLVENVRGQLIISGSVLFDGTIYHSYDT